MELDKLIDRLAHNAHRLRALVENISDEQACWKPDPKSWSILEVVCHLRDEEKEDFRIFLDYTLHRPGEQRPKIAPQTWVNERNYNEQDISDAMRDFLAAREDSITWLKQLDEPDWEITYTAPWGPIKAGDIFSAWVAHDILHMRQLVRLHWAYTMTLIEPFNPKYAGDW